ncbi:uncharacterized protein LOC132639580 [Lycium barbarum]|uniref:uncharacterized protein LOC132639580 n=1 Tax=Lycium barbarum TaxID=112863 RepID=UPI00293F41AB|nr:uncharacterized protein LOC132639580 [Lycium barbarum]
MVTSPLTSSDQATISKAPASTEAAGAIPVSPAPASRSDNLDDMFSNIPPTIGEATGFVHLLISRATRTASRSTETGARDTLAGLDAGMIVHQCLSEQHDQVHPRLYGDTWTHLFTMWTVHGYQKTGCYSTQCPGFIQLSRLIPIDYSFPRTSDIETDYKEVLLRVYQTEDFDYHLVLPTIDEEIGMWNWQVFDRLSADAANLVQHGGKVYTPAGEDISPPMGNGQFRGGHWQLTSYMRKVLYEIEVNDHKQEVPPDDSKVEPHESRCFYEGNHYNAKDGYWDYNFLFGSAGGGDQSEFCQY